MATVKGRNEKREVQTERKVMNQQLYNLLSQWSWWWMIGHSRCWVTLGMWPCRCLDALRDDAASRCGKTWVKFSVFAGWRWIVLQEHSALAPLLCQCSGLIQMNEGAGFFSRRANVGLNVHGLRQPYDRLVLSILRSLKYRSSTDTNGQFCLHSVNMFFIIAIVT